MFIISHNCIPLRTDKCSKNQQELENAALLTLYNITREDIKHLEIPVGCTQAVIYK